MLARKIFAMTLFCSAAAFAQTPPSIVSEVDVTIDYIQLYGQCERVKDVADCKSAVGNMNHTSAVYEMAAKAHTGVVTATIEYQKAAALFRTRWEELWQKRQIRSK